MTVLPLFGFSKPTNIEMPDELSGTVPTPAWKRRHKGYDWYTGDTVNIGIGQGMLTVTPLQLAAAVAIIAEHGKRFQPHLTLKWANPDNSSTVAPNIPLPPVDLKNSSYWNTVISGMEAVVNGGTARRYGPHPGYSVAGKTGTAQVYGTYLR